MFSLNEEDDLFPLNASSNLANLFSSSSTRTYHTDLKYTAPRQPKPFEIGHDENRLDNKEVEPKVAVVCAKVVLSSKIVKNEEELIGKLGLALVGTDKLATELLLYRDKQNIITKASVDASLVLHQYDQSLRFSNASEVIWVAQFTNSQDQTDFIRELKVRNVKIHHIEPEIQKPSIPNKSHLNKDIEEKENKPEVKEKKSEDGVHSRPDILSRMARMGQSVLPITNVNETKKEEINDNHVEVKKSNHPTVEVVSNHLELYRNEDQTDHIYKSDFVRIDNNEISSNIAKISTKVDLVLSEITKLKISPNTYRLENEFLKSKIADLEEELKLHTNDNLNVQELRLKYTEKQSQLESYEKEMKQLHVVNRDLKLAIGEMQEKLKMCENSKKNEEALYAEIEVLKTVKDDVAKENNSLADLNEKLTKKLSDFEGKINKETNLDSGVVKEVMNRMFQSILGDFDEVQTIGFKELKTSLAKHMKQATFSIIEKI